MIGALDPSQKSLKIYSSRKLEVKSIIEVGMATIIAAVYVQKNNSLILSTNDKYLNFYDIEEIKFVLVRRFSVPDTQSFLKVSQ